MNKQATNHTKNQSRKEWLAVVTRNRGGTWVGENRGSFQSGTYRTYEVTIAYTSMYERLYVEEDWIRDILEGNVVEF